MIASFTNNNPVAELSLVAAPAVVAAIRVYAYLLRNDKLIARIFSERRDLWDALGGPTGWRWKPPKGVRPATGLRNYIDFEWFRSNEPEWLLGAPEFVADYRVVRADIRRWSFGELPAFVGWCIIFLALLT